jgi:hypothetical protein
MPVRRIPSTNDEYRGQNSIFNLQFQSLYPVVSFNAQQSLETLAVAVGMDAIYGMAQAQERGTV